jgi:glutamyl-tRNA synthetase
VVDDHLMKITHVMRAQEWIPSTPLHVLMYNAFGWEPPVFCHLPMVMGNDGQKLSKRHGATSVNEFRRRGYLPKALVNYVAMLGASYEEGRDIFALADLERLFSTDHLNKAPAVFDYKKLEWFNGQYLRSMSDEELYDAVLPFLTGTGDAALPVQAGNGESVPVKTGTAVSGISVGSDGQLCARDKSAADVHDELMRLMPIIKERLHFLEESAQMASFLFTEPAVPSKEELIPKKLDAEKTKQALTAAVDFVRAIETMSHDDADALVHQKAELLGIKPGDFMMPIRLAVTGSRISPPLIASIAILGTEKAVARIEKALELF